MEEKIVPIPSVYLSPCYPEITNEGMTIQDVIVEQDRVIGVCNEQLNSIRNLNKEALD